MSEFIEIDEDLRNLSWKILITRDDLLRIAEKLPAQTRERAHQTAGRLAPLRANVQHIPRACRPEFPFRKAPSRTLSICATASRRPWGSSTAS